MTSPRIFIVDDSRLQLFLLEKLLKQEGFEVRSFLDGYALVSAIEECQPDLIVSDIDMPGINGFELVELIRSRFSESNLPFFLISANTDDDIHIKVNKMGIEAFFKKPFPRQHLIESILKQFNLSPTKAKG